MYYVRSLKREILNLTQLFKSFNMNREYFDKFISNSRAVLENSSGNLLASAVAEFAGFCVWVWNKT